MILDTYDDSLAIFVIRVSLHCQSCSELGLKVSPLVDEMEMGLVYLLRSN